MDWLPRGGVPGLNFKREVEWSYKLEEFRGILVRENHMKLSKQEKNILRGCHQLQPTEKTIQGGLTNEGNLLPIIGNTE